MKTALSPTGGSEHVLLVEDEEAVRRVVTRVLKGLGYQVTEARDGLDALTVATKLAGPPDLLVTDIVMPRISGRELVDSLRQLWPSLRVLFMSGYADETVGESGPLAPGAAFLAKPFLPEQLAAKVREALLLTVPSKAG